MATILVAAPVAASSPWTVFGQAGTNAYAFSEDCTDNVDGMVSCHGESTLTPTRSSPRNCWSARSISA